MLAGTRSSGMRAFAFNSYDLRFMIYDLTDLSFFKSSITNRKS